MLIDALRKAELGQTLGQEHAPQQSAVQGTTPITGVVDTALLDQIAVMATTEAGLAALAARLAVWVCHAAPTGCGDVAAGGIAVAARPHERGAGGDAGATPYANTSWPSTHLAHNLLWEFRSDNPAAVEGSIAHVDF